MFCQTRAHAGAQVLVLKRNVAAENTELNYGHHRSIEYARYGKTVADSTRTGKTGTGAGTRDGHVTTYSTMHEHVLNNCTTCYMQVKKG